MKLTHVIYFIRRLYNQSIYQSLGFSSQECNLHIHGPFSQSRNVIVPSGPLSVEAATGLVIAHGKSNSLQITKKELIK